MPTLTQIVRDWIKRDPLLKKHIKLDKFDPADTGAYVGTCPDSGGISYAVGYIGGTDPQYPTTTWDWTFKRGSALHINNKIHHPGDPQFFENLKIGLISGHNSLSKRTKCKIVSRPTRM